MIEDPDTKIGRPRQVYVGEAEREFVAMADREAANRAATP
jgi:citrate synthase